jgi:HAMP domain-containing protein
MAYKFTLRTKFAIILGSIVAVSIAFMFYWVYYLSKKAVLDQVDTQARVLLRQIVTTRQWISDQGGLYIRKKQGTSSHPLLAHLDIKGADGATYVFRNPAMVTRELSEYSEKTNHYRFRLTSLKLRNPANAPSDFEKSALINFNKLGYEKSRDGIARTAVETGEPVYQRIIPLYTEKGCLKCHADQGYREGDIRGGISVTVPLKEAYAAISETKLFLTLAGFAFVSIVLGGLYLAVWVLILRPVKHLHNTALKIGSGEDVDITYFTTGDELEDLAKAFKDMFARITTAYEREVKTLVNAIEARDPYTKGHTDRVARYSIAVAKEMGLPEDQLKRVEMGAVLHDVGKIGVADAILLKSGRLTGEERLAMEIHTEVGANIVTGADLLLWDIPAVRYHHERFDGKGYPAGLKGEEIPLVARIIAVADSFDAMTTDRPYRRALSLETAIAELEKGKGSQFDPEVVESFKKVIYKAGFNTFSAS